MSKQIQMQIDDARNEIKVWNNFSDAVSELNDDEVIQEGGEDYKMVWTSNKVDYYFDHSTLNLLEQLVAKNGGIITNVKFSIPNYNVRKGIDSCLKQIGIEIENIEKRIDSLEQNLKPSK